MKFKFLFCLSLFITPFFLPAQSRDTVYRGVKYHLLSESRDTGTAWIQFRVKKKKGIVNKGIYIELYPDGKLKAKGFMKNGKLKEKWTDYYPDGNKWHEGYYDKGYRSYLWTCWYPDGKMQWKGSYYKNYHAGFWRFYYNDGTLKAMTRYVVSTYATKDTIVAGKKLFFRRKARTMHYIVAPRDTLVEYYPDGKLKTRYEYDDKGQLNDSCVTYYQNGKINEIRIYDHGKKTGKWDTYCENGEFFFCYFYNKDETSSPCDMATGKCEYHQVEPTIDWLGVNH